MTFGDISEYNFFDSKIQR